MHQLQVLKDSGNYTVLFSGPLLSLIAITSLSHSSYRHYIVWFLSSALWVAVIGIHFPADGTEEAFTLGHIPKVSGDWVWTPNCREWVIFDLCILDFYNTWPCACSMLTYLIHLSHCQIHISAHLWYFKYPIEHPMPPNNSVLSVLILRF